MLALTRFDEIAMQAEIPRQRRLCRLYIHFWQVFSDAELSDAESFYRFLLLSAALVCWQLSVRSCALAPPWNFDIIYFLYLISDFKILKV